jgi:hypothetical protein
MHAMTKITIATKPNIITYSIRPRLVFHFPNLNKDKTHHNSEGIDRCYCPCFLSLYNF